MDIGKLYKQKLFSFEYTGKLVSINKWHTLRKNRFGKYFICTSHEYKRLLINLANLYAIRKLLLKQNTYNNNVDMFIKVSRQKLADTGNIEKPIGDALQKAGIIKNDRQIRHIFIYREYHKKGDDDILSVTLYKGEEGIDV